MKKLTEKKGFTLAELLIVVAIIAVLVAIAIPVFSGQMRKSQETADTANLRAAYGQALAEYMGASTAEARKAISSKTNGTYGTKSNALSQINAALNYPSQASWSWKSGNLIVSYTGQKASLTLGSPSGGGTKTPEGGATEPAG